MTREARAVLPGTPLHVVQRGIARNACFFEPEDYARYLYFLNKSAERFACSVHAYCLMTNHVHLLLTPHDAEACGRFMKYLGQCYVQAVNKRLERNGTLWEGRFRSSPVLSDGYVLACYRYIELNPVRAGIVDAPWRYEWSSYIFNAGGQPNGVLRAHPAYESLASEAAERAARYESMFADQLPSKLLVEIRKASAIGSAVGARRRGRGRPFKSK